MLEKLSIQTNKVPESNFPPTQIKEQTFPNKNDSSISHLFNVYADSFKKGASNLIKQCSKESLVIGGGLLSMGFIPLFNLKPVEAASGISLLTGGVILLKSLRASSSQNTLSIKKIALAILFCSGFYLSVLSVKTPNERTIELVKEDILRLSLGEKKLYPLYTSNLISFPSISKLINLDQFACACRELIEEKQIDVGGTLDNPYYVRRRLFPDDDMSSAMGCESYLTAFVPPTSVCDEFKNQWTASITREIGLNWNKQLSHTWGQGEKPYQSRFWGALGDARKIESLA